MNLADPNFAASEDGPARKGREPAWQGRNLALFVIAAAAALAVIIPAVFWGFSCGHDFDFHAISWLDCSVSWHQGILYPHWAESPNFGTGEPRFVFYPPFTWMLGAVLGNILPWQAVANTLAGLLLAGIGFATRALARETLPEVPATLAGCLAIFSGYALFTVYERSAYAELAGGIWIPLLLMYILRERRRGESSLAPTPGILTLAGGSTLPLTLIVAAAWLTNAPVGVMASYLLAATAATVAIMACSWIPVVRAAIAAALGIGLSAFYLVPAAWEQRSVDIRQATDDPGLLVQNSFLFARHHVPALEDHDIELAKVSAIAATMIAIAFLALALCWKRRRLPGGRSWWLPLALIPAVVLLLQLPISLPIWQLFPKFRFLQFPWRWMLVVEAPMAIFIAAAVNGWPARGRKLAGCAFALILIAIAFSAGLLLHQSCDAEDTMMSLRYTQAHGVGVEGSDEYAPPGADNTTVALGLPGGCLVSDPATPLGEGDPDLSPVWSPDQNSCAAIAPLDHQSPGLNAEHRRLRANLARPGYLVLALRRYPAWRVSLNGQPATVVADRQDGLMAIAAPAGPIDLRVDWVTTPDVLCGRSISAVALLLVATIGVLARRNRGAGRGSVLS